ncbi:MAG: LysM peptidoglycan-binding domain-containing protein [Proteobacteria bacterium]|nr:LysM peptidoglycan-binding domain-containing protein [Pseudomonadota bacterium]
MNPTGPLGPRRPLLWACCALVQLLLFAAPVRAENPVPRPPELERDVQFWIRVYSQIDTNSGFLHDEHNLAIVYDTLHFAPNTTPSERQRTVDGERDRIAAALKRIAAGETPLSADEQRIKELWGAEGTPERLAEAVDDIRFQLGQSDRFRAGLVRSGAWKTHIEETLANLGLPAELAVLPHVESSFNPAAYSKVGAAGLFQFMRSTGRRYMRIDSAVDDRLDPFRATEAAAQLLTYNYRLLGTWPLALTAYNHGSAGVLRAKEAMGTDDIVKIVRGYNGRTFGFASRNFYVSFLAALEIDRNPEKYFGPLQRDPEARFREVQMPAYVSMSALTRTLKIDSARLRPLNPGLLPPVWSGAQRVPKAYHLRLPLEGDAWTSERLAQRLAPGDMFTAQRGPERYRVQKGDTLASIAATYEVSVESLARLNHLRTSARVSPGKVLVLPEPAPAVVVAAVPAPAPAAPAGAALASTVAPPSRGGAVPAAVAQRESAEDAEAAASSASAASLAAKPARARVATVTVEVLTAAQAEALGPSLGPAPDAEQNADPTDYGVARDDTIRVATDETLGHIADWSGLSAGRLRELNHLSARAALRVGERLKLEFKGSGTRETFESRRKEYHRTVQASYFAAHRIIGTQVYIARSGDSLWTITQRGGQLPQWLLQQYNPSLDFSDLRAGTQVVMPRVEEVSGAGG